ncbi:MAG: hypothetical protein GH158_02535 [Dehalococcoidia bacterium]|nr:hypothetical protein [Dehalococcoidia bacterium]
MSAVEQEGKVLRPANVFWFYLPLAVMWLTMGLENPIITAFIARLPEVRENLAAFGVAFSLALVVASPIIMLITAATALAYNRANYNRLLSFTNLLSLMLTLLHLLIGVTPLYRIIVDTIIGVPEVIIEPSRRAFLVMIPWAAALAYRRLFEGVLIRFKKTGLLPITTLSRLVTVIVVLAVGFSKKMAGASLGAGALSCGVVVSAVISFAFCQRVVRAMPEAEKGECISWRQLIHFYAPLALTSFLTLSSMPLLSIGLARAPEPLSSLAVWPVITGVMLIIRSLAMAAQEVVVALIAEQRSFTVLQRFTRVLSLVLVGILAIFAFSPLSGLWFSKVAGLSGALTDFARVPMMILFLIPGLETMLSWNRGLLVHEKRTRVISQAVMLNLVVLVTVMFIGAAILPIKGAVTAAIALTSALGLESFYLWWRHSGK